jgi:hypothetical protein
MITLKVLNIFARIHDDQNWKFYNIKKQNFQRDHCRHYYIYKNLSE